MIHRRLIGAIVVVSLVVYGSLYPWHFDFARSHENPLRVLLRDWPRGWDRFIIRDAFANVLFYVPVGMALYLALAEYWPPTMAFIAAALSAVFLSANMEMLQIYVPDRVCSLLDVMTNSAGGLAGALAGRAYRRKYPESGQRARPHLGALVLLACWAAYQLYPLVPLLSRTRLGAGLTYLLHSSIHPVEVWANAAEWFAVGLAMEAVDVDLPPAWVALPMLCMPVRILMVGRTLSLDELIGGALALFLLFGMRQRSRARAAIWLLGSAILLRELSPFHFLPHPAPFSWIPFRASLEAERNSAILVFLRRLFDYGAIIWLLRARRIRHLYSGAALAVVLFACEWTQRYLPGRTPEITDSLVALLGALILWLADRDDTGESRRKIRVFSRRLKTSH